MTKAQAHFRLEPDLLEAIKAKAEAEKVTVTDLVTRFLMQGLGLDTHTDTQNVNQEVIEESVYQRISERVADRISELNSSWEKRISERIADRISELNSSWEKRISERIADRISELNSSWEKRISERIADRISELNSSWEKRISERIADRISELNSSWEKRISERIAEEDVVSSSEVSDAEYVSSGISKTPSELKDNTLLDDSQVSSNLGGEAPKKKELESPLQLNIIESTSNPQSSLLEELSLPGIKLGERLSIDRTTLSSRRKRLSAQEFANMTSKKDPNGIKWVYSEERKSYVPLEPLSDEQSENLKIWKEQRSKK